MESTLAVHNMFLWLRGNQFEGVVFRLGFTVCGSFTGNLLLDALSLGALRAGFIEHTHGKS